MNKKRNHVVRYPNVNKEKFFTLQELTEISAFKGAVGMLKAATELPKKTVFDWSASGGVTYFHIILPDGRIFTGAAIHKHNDKNDITQGVLIATGRALAVWRSVKKLEYTHFPIPYMPTKCGNYALIPNYEWRR